MRQEIRKKMMFMLSDCKRKILMLAKKTKMKENVDVKKKK